MSQSRLKFDNLILWAAVFPEDIELESIKESLTSPVQILFGDKDHFYNLDQIRKLNTTLTKLDNNIEFTTFNGAHKIYSEPLNNLFHKLLIS